MNKKATVKALVDLINYLTDKELLMLTDSKNRLALKEFLHKTIIPPANNFSIKKTVWQERFIYFYYDVFGLIVNISTVKLPPETEDVGCPLVIAEELGDKPINTAIAACQQLFPTWPCADDLDKIVLVNDRTPANGSYAICVRDRVEADEENKYLSADSIKLRNLVTMTLLERIVLELYNFWNTKEHLDIRNWTLCSGSRYSDGNVPVCYCVAGKFRIFWCEPDYSFSRLRARIAVSAKSSLERHY